MKKDLLTHFLFMVAYVAIIVLLKRWFAITYLPFLYGAVLGTILPDIDFIIYAYLLNQEQITAASVGQVMSKKSVFSVWKEFVEKRREKKGLIFHTATFQVVFLVFAFFVITSSGSLLGQGLVLAFLLHIIVDEVQDLMEVKNLDNWFAGFPVTLDRDERRWFLIGNGLLVLFLGMLI